MNYEFFQVCADISSKQAEDNVIKLLNKLGEGYKIISAVSVGSGVQYILGK